MSNSNIHLLYQTKRKLRFKGLITEEVEEVKFLEYLKKIAKTPIDDDITLRELLNDLLSLLIYFSILRPIDWEESGGKGHDIVRDAILEAGRDLQANLELDDLKYGCPHQGDEHYSRNWMSRILGARVWRTSCLRLKLGWRRWFDGMAEYGTRRVGHAT